MSSLLTELAEAAGQIGDGVAALCLDSLLVAVDDDDAHVDLAALPVPLAGALQATGDPWEPYRLVDAAGEPVAAVDRVLPDLQAAGRSEATLRSYGLDLLRWFRFYWAAGCRGTGRRGPRPALS